MSCREYRSGLIEWGRGRVPREAARQVLAAHLDECSECARFLETQQALTAALTGLAGEPIPPASRFLASVMAEFDRVHPPRRARFVRVWWTIAAAAAAAVIFLLLAMVRDRVPRPRPLPQPAGAKLTTRPAPPVTGILPVPPPRPRSAAFRKSAPEPEQPFYPVPYTAPLAPGEWTRVERMSIPEAALIAVGFHLVADPAATVEADVLVSQDGRARAIRPLSISLSN